MTPWAQELMWVKRNEQGVIVGISTVPPKSEDFVPTLPPKDVATASGVYGFSKS